MKPSGKVARFQFVCAAHCSYLCVLICSCTLCLLAYVCVQLYILSDHGTLAVSGRQIETERHYQDPRTSIFHSLCVRVCVFVCMCPVCKNHSSLTNYAIFMHDLAKDFEHTHAPGIIKLSQCCLLPSALPMTTKSHQHSHLTFCCCSNHRLTICQKDKKRRAGRQREMMG